MVLALRGRNGGVSLARPAAQIKLYDIVTLFMKMEDFKRCFLGLNDCGRSCGLHIRWQIIAEQYEKLMNETTVEQLI